MPDLTVEVKIKNSTRNGANEAKREVKSIGDEAQNTARRTQSSLAKIDFSGISEKLKNVGSQITGIGQQLTVGLTLPIAAVTTLGLKFNATKEQALVSFGVLLKSGEKAKQLFSELLKFSADTPFEMPEIQTAAKSLLAFGVAQENILPTLTRIGDIASGISEPMTELAEIYGKAKTQGRLFAEDINQLTERGIPIIQELAKQFGVSEDKVKGLVESGKVGFPQLEKAFADMTGEGGRFSGMMQAQSKTFSGLMSTLADAANTTLGQLTEPLFNFIRANLPLIIGVLSQVGEAFNNLSPTIKTIILGIIGFAAALGPVLVILGGLVTVIGTVVGAIGSIASGIAALGGLSVALPIIAAIITAISLLVAGIGAAIGVIYGLIEAWQNGFGPVASYVALVVGGILTAISPILGLPILIGAVLATIYGIWTTNFGGIQEVVAAVIQNVTTLINNFIAQIKPYIVDGVRFIQQKFAEYWNKFAPVVSDSSNQIRAYLFETWAEISAFLQENLAGITEYFRENWDSIREAIGRVMDAVVLAVRVGIEAVRQFWADHGEQIKAVVKSAWNIVWQIVSGIVKQIGNVIKLVTSIINGDWGKAWQAFKDLVVTGVSGLGSILGSLINIIWQIIKAGLTRIWAMMRDNAQQTVAIGRFLIEGLIRGITNAAGALYNKLKEVASGALNTLKSFWGVKSPAQEFIKISEFAAEGLILGFNNKADNVKKAVKKIAKDALAELRKEFEKAKKEFEDLLGSSFEKQNLIVSTSNFQDAKTALETLIKLRAETGLNVGEPLPDTLPKIKAEIEAQNEQIQGRNEAIRLLKEYEDAVRDYGIELTHVEKIERLLKDPNKAVLIDEETAARLRQAAAARDAADAAKKLADARESILKSGFNERTDIDAQINSYSTNSNTGIFGQITDEIELERIKRAAEWAKFANENKTKYTADELENLRKLKEAEDELYYAKLRNLQAVKDRAASDKSYLDLLSDLNSTVLENKDILDELNGITTEAVRLSEVTRVQKLLETDAYKNLTAEQKQALLNKAAEVDSYKQQVKAAQEAKDKMQAIYNGLSDSIHRVLSASVRGGFKEGLKAAFDELKNFGLQLLDTILRELSNRLAQFILKKIFGGSSSASGSSGGGIFGGIFDSIKKLFGFGRGASGVSGLGGSTGAAHASALGGGKRFNLASSLALAGTGGLVIGGLIGGRAGRTISGAGSGLALGASIGSIVPGVGTVIGAVVGAIAGGIFGLFGGDPKRRIDKKENMPKLQEGFRDAFEQLRQLTADKNAFFNDPEGTIQKAKDLRGQIASGFGIQFQSKKYRQIAQQQIAQKLAEADRMIKEMEMLRDQAVQARDIDQQLNANFATGVYMDSAFLRQYGQFKRRNGMLDGQFTGRDTLPSMLAQGEMVLNPRQMANVIRNAGGVDVFQNAGIPNYADGAFIGTNQPAQSSPSQTSKQPLQVKIYLSNSGMVESDVLDVVVEGLQDDYELQTELVKSYDKTKRRTG